MDENKSDKPHRSYIIGADLFWPSLAAVIIAFMAYGYSCDGCMECHAPAMEQRGDIP